MKFNFFKKIWGRKEERDNSDISKTNVEEQNFSENLILKTSTDFPILPIITEKTMALSKEGKYTFIVPSNVNKVQFKKVLEKLFNVKVEAVKVMNYKERIRGITKIKSRRKRFKKMIVKIGQGQTIPIFE